MITSLLYAPVEPKHQIDFALEKMLAFQGASKAISYSKEKPENPFVDHIQPEPMTWAQQQKHQACYLIDLLPPNSTHLLHCETDGFPINPHLWDNKWLQYDYIGAPWGVKGCVTVSTGGRVGNGGFSLRSRRFLEVMWKYRNEYPQDPTPSDMWMCQRGIWASRGVKFAPISEAIKFSFEAPIPEFPKWESQVSFGFHGRNLHPHLCV